MKPSFRTLAFFCLMAGTATTGCEEEPAFRTIEIPLMHYEGAGVVTDYLDESALIVIRHGEIEGYMMAMTMPFQVREDSVRASFSVGDSIAFQLTYDGTDSWITQITVFE